MSFCNLLYHIVFATKNREQLIRPEIERRVYGLLYTIMTNKKAHVLRIGGMMDHVHIFVNIPPDISVSEFIKELKRESSIVMKSEKIIPNWNGWQNGYAAFSYSRYDIDKIVTYITNQKEHHRTVSFIDEYKAWLIENGISETEPYFPK